MSQASDFVIRNGVLLEYTGNDRVVRVPDGVLGICEKAFWYAFPEEVYLPEGLVWLASNLFLSSSLRRLVLPGTLRIIPSFLCNDCQSLEEVVIPEGVVFLSYGAFSETGLESVTIPDSVEAIGDSCFENCRKLKKVSLGRGVQRIGVNTFGNCKALPAISLPASLRSINNEAFQGCSRLKAVSMESGLLSVESSVFADCPQLREVTFPDTLESLNSDAFGEVSTTERVTLPGSRAGFQPPLISSPPCSLAGVIRAPRLYPEWIPAAFRPAALAGFREMQAERYPLDPDIAAAWEAFAAGADPDSPENLKEPFRIVDGVLCGAARAEGRVVVPDGVVGIRAEAFQETDIREIRLPDSVEWIQPEAFARCTKLEAVRLPAGLTRIPDGLFAGCEALKAVRIPDRVTRIEDAAFLGSGLEALSLPPSLRAIDDFAFFQCHQLTEVRFPEGLREIRWSAFSDCPALTGVALPNSLEFLDELAFEDCPALEHVSLGAGLYRLESDSFLKCSGLKNVTVAGDFFFLDDETFKDCPSCLRLRTESSFACLGPKNHPFQIVAPNLDPAVLAEDHLRALLLGFASEDGEGFRYETEYLELMRLHMRELLDSEIAVRFLLRHDMLERKDIPDCLQTLQEKGLPNLVAELLEYSHQRFPEPAGPLFLE